jgi:lipopolysaccharide transport system ATP-binding protein
VSDIAIRAEGLGKRYRLGQTERYQALRDRLADALHMPVRLAQRWLADRKGALALPGPPLRREGNARSQSDGRTFWALRDVAFEVPRGQVLGVIGRNGAGKSTLLKILSRVTEPTTGMAEINGRVGSLLEVGTGFHPELTGRENVFLNGAIQGMSQREIRRKFDEIVAFAEVESFLDTPVKRYSSGMYTRLAFAVAAHLEPEILIVDEVLAVGDAAFQRKCLGKMSEVAAGGRTVLFVSHNMNAVEELCDAVLLLERGRVARQSREVRDVIVHYLNGGGAGAGHSAEWWNAGNDYANVWFQPLSMSVTDGRGRPVAAPVRSDAEYWLEIVAQVSRPDAALNVGYELLDDGGRVLYWSCATDAGPQHAPRIPPGAIRLRTRIPSRLLNEGDYQLRLMASLHCREWLCPPGVDAPTVHLSIRGGMSDSPFWLEKRPGVLAPVIGWTCESANEIRKSA